MINEVRNSVMFILNKDNRGYITPMEFNTYARQAQLDIFQKYMYEYSNAIVKQNARYHGEGYSNIAQRISEVIDRLSEYDTLQYNALGANVKVPFFKKTAGTPIKSNIFVTTPNIRSR